MNVSFSQAVAPFHHGIAFVLLSEMENVGVSCWLSGSWLMKVFSIFDRSKVKKPERAQGSGRVSVNEHKFGLSEGMPL